MNLDFLRQTSIFAGLSKEDLDWLVQNSEIVTHPSGDLLIEQGSEGDSAYVILDGALEVQIRSSHQDVYINELKTGEVIGEMALLDKSPRSATVRVLRNSHLLRIPQETFEQLLTNSPNAALGILRTVMERLRHNEALLHHHEKMAGLGTLSAGLAHELNNPASAAQRSSETMRNALSEWRRLSGNLYLAASKPEQFAWLDNLHHEVMERAITSPNIDAVERVLRTESMQTWLEQHGFQHAWEIAPSLVSLGWVVKDMEELVGSIAGSGLDVDEKVVIQWLGSSGIIYSLLDEIRWSTERIVKIVRAMKSYTYLDQAPIQEVDIHEGLENTLMILQHKLKQGVVVHREYSPDLPKIEAYASELNQVWTNLIDNAVDAMQGNGQLSIHTFSKNGDVVVEITDSGSGIPDDIQPRIFEAFFTTKPPGEGSGLGLHTAYNIVVQRHHGTIDVQSQPGSTRFTVCLHPTVNMDETNER